MPSLFLIPFYRLHKAVRGSSSSMSQRHSSASLGDSALLLAHQLNSDLHVSTNGKRNTTAALDNAAFSAECAPSSSLGPRRIVLSTESPVALRVGTQQVIPKGLAESPKSKAPTRHQSFSAAVLSKEAARCEPKRLSVPSISFEDLDEMDLGGGTLKRNLRNMSYRAAMKTVGNDEQAEASKFVATLKPLSEEGRLQGAHSPGRNKVGPWLWLMCCPP